LRARSPAQAVTPPSYPQPLTQVYGRKSKYSSRSTTPRTSSRYPFNCLAKKAIFEAMPDPGVEGSTIVIGGDGRYYNKEVMQIIAKMAAANDV
jgi:phosphoglucomutase